MQQLGKSIFAQKHSKIIGLLLMCVIMVAAVLRLYNLPNTLTFQADQARDAEIVSQMFLQHKLVFIGPVTSVGNMYLGPLYYYFMLPFLLLSYPSPLGPAYGVAFAGILTVFLFYKLGKIMLGETAGFVSAFLASISTFLIYFSRFSWNPNLVPLFSLVMIFFTYLAWKKSPKYWLAVAVSFSVLLQLHYITIIMMFGAGFFWCLALIHILRSDHTGPRRPKLISFLQFSLLSVLIVVLSFTPLMLFDSKHHWVNLKAFESIFTSEKILSDQPQFTIGSLISGIVRESHGRSIEVLFVLFFGKVTQIQNLLLVGTGIYLAYFVKFRKKLQNWDGQFVVLIYLVTSILGISSYKRSIFDHYLLFIVPMSLWFLSASFCNFKNHWVGKVGLVVFLGCYSWYNLQNLPLKSAGWTIFKVKGVTDLIEAKLQPNEKYDLVLLSESGDSYGLNYRYFLEASPIKPISLGSTLPVTTLVIINENQKNADVIKIPIYQIQVFGKPKSMIQIQESDGPNIEIWRK